MDKSRIATWNDTLATPLPPGTPGNTSTILLCVTFSLIGTFGIVGNALVISIIERMPTNNRAASLHLICSQAVNDLVASLLIIPVTLCGLFSVPPPQNSTIVGNIYCRFIYSYSILFITFSLSTYNLTILAYERYMAVVKPMVYKAKFTKAHSKKCVYISWILAPLAQMVLMIFQFDYDRRNGTCISENPSFGPLFQSIVGTMIFVWEYLIPASVMFVTYGCIVRRLRLQRKRIESWNTAMPNALRSSRKKTPRAQRVTITLLLCSCIFIICWTPNQIIFLYYNFGGNVDFTSTFYNLSVLLVFLNSCRNPIVYTFRYRKDFGRLKHILKS